MRVEWVLCGSIQTKEGKAACDWALLAPLNVYSSLAVANLYFLPVIKLLCKYKPLGPVSSFSNQTLKVINMQLTQLAMAQNSHSQHLSLNFLSLMDPSISWLRFTRHHDWPKSFLFVTLHRPSYFFPFSLFYFMYLFILNQTVHWLPLGPI